MEYFDKIKLWDTNHCEQHVVNLVGNISNILKEKKINELCYLDIGSNVGKVYDLLNEKIKINKVWMFEASPLLYEYSKMKYENNYSVIIKNVAISKNVGKVNFDESSIIHQIKTNSNDLNFGLSKISNYHPTTSIHSDKISNIIKNSDEIMNNVSFIKIDTENVDFEILDDLFGVIDKFKIKPIIEFEINYFVNGMSKLEAQSIIDKFQLKGYNSLRIEDCYGDGILIPN